MATVVGEFGLTCIVQGNASNTNLTRCRVVKPAKEIEQCAFSTPAGAGDRGKSPRLEIKRDAIQCANLPDSGGINARDVLQ